jgi:hypothetical protein
MRALWNLEVCDTTNTQARHFVQLLQLYPYSCVLEKVCCPLCSLLIATFQTNASDGSRDDHPVSPAGHVEGLLQQ